MLASVARSPTVLPPYARADAQYRRQPRREAIMEAITRGNQRGKHKRQSERQLWRQSQEAIREAITRGNQKAIMEAITRGNQRGNYGGNHKRQSERQSQKAIREAIMESITRGNHKRQLWRQSQEAIREALVNRNQEQSRAIKGTHPPQSRAIIVALRAARTSSRADTEPRAVMSRWMVRAWPRVTAKWRGVWCERSRHSTWAFASSRAITCNQ
jgi:hypothetical protein